MKYEPSITKAEIAKFIEVSHRDFAHTNRHANDEKSFLRDLVEHRCLTTNNTNAKGE